MSEQQEPQDWDQALADHFEAAECEQCGLHVEMDVTGDYLPIGAGVWAVWYHYACNPKAFGKDE